MNKEHPWVGKTAYIRGAAHRIVRAEAIMTLDKTMYTRFWVACELESRIDIGSSYIIEEGVVTCLKCHYVK